MIEMPPDVSNTSKITISQSLIVPVSPNMLPTATLFQAANDDMKFHPSFTIPDALKFCTKKLREIF
ncbi:unnamed protein product [Hymenolepis diminuta]|uniref:Uncharacterized protein n=1 Tax=Hymenolepis diminuta TaxID=6216 RepID=A0A564YDT7_HYMDI|nr:unnamed protein product [Hymenolepis diminuta]